VIGLGLRQLQDALNRKADRIQHEFVDLSEELEEVGRKLLEAEEGERSRTRSMSGASGRGMLFSSGGQARCELIWRNSP
jgi:hypothetical protein